MAPSVRLRSRIHWAVPSSRVWRPTGQQWQPRGTREDGLCQQELMLCSTYLQARLPLLGGEFRRDSYYVPSKHRSRDLPIVRGAKR